MWLCVTSAELGSQILSKRSSPATAAEPSPGSRHSPSGDTPQIIDPNALIRIRSPAQKSLGEAFGAATGVRRPPGNADVSSAGVERRRGRRRSQGGARATSGVERPRGADWGDRVGGLKGVAYDNDPDDKNQELTDAARCRQTATVKTPAPTIPLAVRRRPQLGAGATIIPDESWHCVHAHPILPDPRAPSPAARISGWMRHRAGPR